MAVRRVEGILVGLLLVGCVGAIAFVFAMMNRPGGGFRPEKDTLPVRAHAPVTFDDYEEPSAPPDSIYVEVETEPTLDEEKEDEFTDEPVDPHELAKLTIELLLPAEVPDQTITVVVRDEAGEPIEDALAVFRAGTAMLYRERTGMEGAARFTPYEFERGPFRIDAIAYGYVPNSAPSVLPGVETELILKARPIIEGRVRAPSQGHGLVKLFTGDGVLTTKIENDGSFGFEDLDEGPVTVQAEVEPYGTASQSFFLEAGTVQTVRLFIRKRSRVNIFGEIGFWKPEGKAWINGVPVAVTASGAYEFDKAVYGLNEIFIDVPGKSLFKERFSVKGQTKKRHDFRLRREGVIKGRVRNARTDRPVAGAEVRLGVNFNDPRNDRVPLFPVERVPVVKTDRDGMFQVGRLDDRLLYVISVVAVGYGQGIKRVLPDAGFTRVELPEGPFLYGSLRGIGGVPRDAVVSAVRLLREKPEGLRFNVSGHDASKSGRDRKGFYGLSGLLPGLYLVRVDAAEYGSIETVVDLLHARRVRLDLRIRRGAHLEQEDAELLSRLPPVVHTDPAELPPDGYTVLFVDAERPRHEPPFPGVRVVFFEEDTEIAAPLEFTESRFDLLGLPEGDYRAILTHPSLKKPLVEDRIELRRGKPVRIEMR